MPLWRKKIFEELIHSDFRWPRNGDAPFTASEDNNKNAALAQDNHTRFVLMIDGYKKASDLMVEQSITARSDRDYLVFPILFNYRQYIELSLKFMLNTYGASVNIAPNWRTHDLSFLWSEFATLLERYGSPDPDDADDVIESIVAQFSKIDPRSFSHRYPVDTNGHQIPLAHEFLDLKALYDVMQGVDNYFNGCDGYLDGLESAKI